MKYILKITFEPFCWILSKSPKFILYGISDFIYVILFYITGYRRKVVQDNLSNSFPEKPKQEIKHITKKFYRNLSDIFIENMAFMKINQKRAKRFVSIHGVDTIERYFKENRVVIVVFGHYANWELMQFLPFQLQGDIIGIYKPLQSKYFNQLYYKMRSRFGATPVPMDDTLRVVLKHHKEKTPAAIGLIADQRPMRKNIQYWTTFLNQDTPLILGPEKISKKINAPVVYVEILRVKRGYYSATISELISETGKTEQYEITEAYIRKLESQIKAKPEQYLWSHKRWKHKREITNE